MSGKLLAAEIAKLKTKLLDLSFRNGLLSLKYDRNTFLRIIDEVPALLMQKILDGFELELIPVPEPSKKEYLLKVIGKDENGENVEERVRPEVKEYASRIGLNTSFELGPAGKKIKSRHQDNQIQTLYYADDLDSKLAKIYSAYRSSLEETGNNSLYFAMGTLEYTASDSSDDVKRAPLFLGSVQIEKKRHTPYDIYSLKPMDEGFQINLSLVEKVRKEFGISLPTPKDDEQGGIKLDEYLENLRTVLETVKPNWRVIWESNLAILNFGTVLLHKDLSDEFWGSSAAEENPLINELLFGDRHPGSDSSVGDYDFDEVSSSSIPKSVLDADSSQQSAIVDVLAGKNLVIQGPPGTGKSQTITNLIAAAIGAGKTVLFVAEKLTALKVVRKRLVDVGLGEFCCEIHSTKTSKKELVESFRVRSETKFSYHDKRKHETEITSFKRLTKAYLKELSGKPDGLSETIFQLYGLVARDETSLAGVLAKFSPLKFSGKSVAVQEINPQITLVADFARSYHDTISEFGEESSHPLVSLSPSVLDMSDQNFTDAIEKLRSIVLSLEENLQDDLKIIKDINGGKSFSVDDLVEWESVRVKFAAVDDRLKGLEQLSFIKNLNVDNLNSAIWLWNNLEKIRSELVQSDVDRIRPYRDEISVFRSLCAKAVDLGSVPLSKISERGDECKKHEIRFKVAEGLFEEIKSCLNLEGELDISSVLMAYKSILHLFEIYVSDPAGYKSAVYFLENKSAYRRLKSLAEDLKSLGLQVSPKFYSDEVLSGEVREVQKRARLIREASFLDFWFSREVKTVGRWLRGVHRESSQKNVRLLAHDLELVVRLREKELELKRMIMTFGDRVSDISDVESDIESVDRVLSGLERTLRDLPFNYTLKLEKPLSISRTSLAELGGRISEGIVELERLKTVLTATGYNLCVSSTFSTIATNQAITGNLADQICSHQVFGFLPDFRVDAVDQWFDLVESQFKAEAGLAAHSNLLSAIESKVGVKRSIQLLNDVLSTCRLLENFHTEVVGRVAAILSLRSLSESVGFANQIVEMNVSGRVIEFDIARIEFDQLCSILDRVFAYMDRKSSWRHFQQVKSRFENSIFSEVYPLIKDGVSSEELEKFCTYSYRKFLVQKTIDSSSVLSMFKGESFQELRENFRKIDISSIENNRLSIAAAADSHGRANLPEGTRGQRVVELTQRLLLSHEWNKDNRHIPIRQLMLRAQKAAMALKPCFMMSPMSVAQFLPLGGAKFDLLVMDEASQLPIEFALGAVARANQIVVVGDSKQLPPSNYFQANAEEEENEDRLITEDAESILHQAALTFGNSRMLKWHYRSKHESLIAFSNKEFYKGDLVLFPSPIQDPQTLGIQYHRVDGVYLGGGRNEIEASKIVEALQLHAQEYPELSVGIATMNAAQKELIQERIEIAAKEDPILRGYLESQPNGEEYFVKNLESVQGDERDVIMISITYGPDESGAFHMRFGPINGKYGARRLNVLFSRARNKMKVFVSFNHEALDAASSNGAKVLQRFLAYAQTGKLETVGIESNREPDSDFEIAVADAIKSMGYDVTCQLGVAGYFIDLAVKHPFRAGRYLVAVECDGATYHSSKSARDRDRLRQQNLENLGWVVLRIWSTDWFKRRTEQYDRLKIKLDHLSGQNNVVQLKDQSAVVNNNSHNQGGIEIEKKLEIFRETVVRLGDPSCPRNHGILRRNVIRAILKYMPSDDSSFRNMLIENDLEVSLGQFVFINSILEIIHEQKKRQVV